MGGQTSSGPQAAAAIGSRVPRPRGGPRSITVARRLGTVQLRALVAPQAKVPIRVGAGTYFPSPPDAVERAPEADCTDGWERVDVFRPDAATDRASSAVLQHAPDAAHDDRATMRKVLQDGGGRLVRVRDTADVDLERWRIRHERIRTGVLEASHISRGQTSRHSHQRAASRSCPLDPGHVQG